MNNENTQNTENKSKFCLFLDKVQRLVLAEMSDKQTEGVFTVKNPVVISVGTDNANRMSVQLFPLFFREFLGDKTADVEVKYHINDVTLSNIDVIDFRLQAQHSQIFNKNNSFVAPQGQPQAAPQTADGGVINLFDS